MSFARNSPSTAEVVITVPGYPKRVEGRESLAELYRGYGDTIILERGSDLAVHHDRERGTVGFPGGQQSEHDENETTSCREGMETARVTL